MKVFILGLPKSGRDTFASAIHGSHSSAIIVEDPKQFINGFDPINDLVVFLNRTDIDLPMDHNGVAINVMRDYCLWLATVGKLPRENWLEYNFKIPGKPNDNAIKQLGKYNVITIAKSIEVVLKHFVESIKLIALKPYINPRLYVDERYCDHCEADTMHDCIDSEHERDSSDDWRQCHICKWNCSGWSDKYYPPYDENE